MSDVTPTPRKFRALGSLFMIVLTFLSALLIGEKCAMLTAEDLGYSGRALDMRVPEYHAPRETTGLSRL